MGRIIPSTLSRTFPIFFLLYWFPWKCSLGIFIFIFFFFFLAWRSRRFSILFYYYFSFTCRKIYFRFESWDYCIHYASASLVLAFHNVWRCKYNNLSSLRIRYRLVREAEKFDPVWCFHKIVWHLEISILNARCHWHPATACHRRPWRQMASFHTLNGFCIQDWPCLGRTLKHWTWQYRDILSRFRVCLCIEWWSNRHSAQVLPVQTFRHVTLLRHR